MLHFSGLKGLWHGDRLVKLLSMQTRGTNLELFMALDVHDFGFVPCNSSLMNFAAL